jgi:VRR-NUC domain.
MHRPAPLIDGDMAMKEKEIEKKLSLEAKKRGGLAVKFVSPGFDGMPDRIVLMPEGKIAFVEVKAPGKRPRPLQMARHKLLKGLGFLVFVLDDESQIGVILDAVQST